MKPSKPRNTEQSIDFHHQFFALQLPPAMEQRIYQLTQKICTRTGKENTQLLDVYYLALENGLDQMEFLENAITVEHEKT